jgi:hypothetical protein
MWCGRPFRARQTGGRVQRFCWPSCRRAFHAAARAWALDAIADGTLSVVDLRNGAAATRALLREATSPLPVEEAPPRHSTPTPALRADIRYTSQSDLERLMSQAIAARRRD